MASKRERRIAENESSFRAANEHMAAWEERDRAEATEYYFCECPDPECEEMVRLPCSDYERARQDSAHFIVVSGHEVLDVENVIEPHEGWSLVEKRPAVQGIVEDTDPRET